MTDFERLVQRMRKAQQEYFAMRTPVYLKAAKQLEYEVDCHLKRAENRDDQMMIDLK